MTKYDLFAAPGGRGYLLDVQTDLLVGLSTRIVVPLLPEDDAPMPARFLNPLVDLGGVRHVMATQFLSAVPEAILKNRVGSLSDRSDDVTRALDMVFQGF